MHQATQYLFKNWAGNQQCTAANYYSPATEGDLIKAITNHAKVRMVGTGHSWSAICLNNEALINLNNYNRVTHIDKEKLQVTVQAGIKLWQLNNYLDTHGLALTNLGSIAEQSVAGAMCTATHGTGINYQVLASQVEQFTLIKANGEKVTLNKQQNMAEFNLAIINLGALGAISEVTLNVVPAFQLHDQTTVAPFTETVDSIQQLVAQTDHFKLWWFPHTKHMVTYRYNRTAQPPNDSRIRQWFMDEFLSVAAYRLFLKIGNLNTNWRIPINRTLVQKFISPLNRIEKSYKVFNVPAPPKHREVEWAFDLQQAGNLLRDYKAMIENSPHRLNFIQEIRFTKADEYALSPCYQRNTIWLGAYNADNNGWPELMADFELLAIKYNGRPHWGKEFTVRAAYLRQQYPLWENFNQLRLLYDPTLKFENRYIAQLFS